MTDTVIVVVDPETVNVTVDSTPDIVSVTLGPISGPPGPPGGGGGGTVDTVARAAAAAAQGTANDAIEALASKADLDENGKVPSSQLPTSTGVTAGDGIDIDDGEVSVDDSVVRTDDSRLTDARTPTTHTHPWSQVSDKPTFGSAATADVGDFAPATHTHTASQVSDSTTVGRSLLTAANAAAARTTLSAAPTSRTLAGLDLTADRSAADLRTALSVRPGVIAPPLPCAMSIMASRIGSNVSAVNGTVYWLPLELLAIPAVATHLWLSVATTGSGVARLGITSAVSAADDTPGPLIASTAAGAVAASSTGARGAALSSPLTLTAGVRYYLTAYISAANISAVGVEGPMGLLASATGSAPVSPAASMAVGWRLTGQSDLVSNPTGLVAANVMPLMHVSLEAP